VVLRGEHGPYLQLTTYGSDSRQIPGKVSQTLQFDREQAKALRHALDSALS
jgi:hypothetical protein